MPPQVGGAGARPGPIATNPNPGVEDVKSKKPESKSTEQTKDTPKNEAAPHRETAKDATTKKSDLNTQGAAQKTVLANQLKETVIRGTSGNDKIHITAAKGKYEIEVDVNGTKQKLTKEQAKNLVIDAGDGNDVVHIDRNVNGNITVKGGRGNDLIIDEREPDIIMGGRGNDYILDRKGTLQEVDPQNRITGGSGNVDIDGEKPVK